MVRGDWKKKVRYRPLTARKRMTQHWLVNRVNRMLRSQGLREKFAFSLLSGTLKKLHHVFEPIFPSVKQSS